MTLDRETTVRPSADGIAAAFDSRNMKPGQDVVKRGEGDSGDSNDESKAGRSAERIDSPVTQQEIEPPLKAEPEPDDDDTPKTGRMAPRLE